mgnify:CR=1 FL=1
MPENLSINLDHIDGFDFLNSRLLWELSTPFSMQCNMDNNLILCHVCHRSQMVIIRMTIDDLLDLLSQVKSSNRSSHNQVT